MDQSTKADAEKRISQESIVIMTGEGPSIVQESVQKDMPWTVCSVGLAG